MLAKLVADPLLVLIKNNMLFDKGGTLSTTLFFVKQPLTNSMDLLNIFPSQPDPTEKNKDNVSLQKSCCQ